MGSPLAPTFKVVRAAAGFPRNARRLRKFASDVATASDR
jgi:hypothetical protein